MDSKSIVQEFVRKRNREARERFKELFDAQSFLAVCMEATPEDIERLLRDAVALCGSTSAVYTPDWKTSAEWDFLAHFCQGSPEGTGA